MTDVDENKSIQIGRRVCVGTYTGVAQYVGQLPGTDFMWVGVEWDDPSRGKHNGVYNDIRYFQTL